MMHALLHGFLVSSLGSLHLQSLFALRSLAHALLAFARDVESVRRRYAGAGVDADYPDDQLPSERELTLDPDVFLRDGLWNALTAGANARPRAVTPLAPIPYGHTKAGKDISLRRQLFYTEISTVVEKRGRESWKALRCWLSVTL